MITLDNITLATLAIFGLFLGIVFPLMWNYHNMFTWFWAAVFVLSASLLTIKYYRRNDN